MKRTPTEVQTDLVLSVDLREGISQAGNKTVRADFVTPYRSFSIWFTPESKGWRQRDAWAQFEAATKDKTPRTVTYRKDATSGFYRLLGLNKEPDIEPEKTAIQNLLSLVFAAMFLPILCLFSSAVQQSPLLKVLLQIMPTLSLYTFV